MRMNRKPLLRLISTLLIPSFLSMEVAWAAPFPPKADPPLAGAALEDVIRDPSLLEMPFEFTTLKELNKGGDRLIIHIQDAHSNLSGQESLAGALDRLIRAYGIQTVLVEGSSADVSLTETRKSAPLETWKPVAKRLLFDGIISGEEYLNLTTEHPM